MGLIIGIAMFAGVIIGIIITTAVSVFALVRTRKISHERIHAWPCFFVGFAVISSILFFAIPYIPFPQPNPGSDYKIIMTTFFFKGVLYAAVLSSPHFLVQRQ